MSTLAHAPLGKLDSTVTVGAALDPRAAEVEEEPFSPCYGAGRW